MQQGRRRVTLVSLFNWGMTPYGRDKVFMEGDWKFPVDGMRLYIAKVVSALEDGCNSAVTP